MKSDAKTDTRKKTRATFFKSSASLRRWLRKHCRAANELMIGFYKKSAEKTGITYPEALDQALCFGWIDGVRRSLDEARYTIRFTPRRPKSKWSLVNTRRFRQLEKMGVIEPTGRAAFKRRDPEKTKEYSYENRSLKLDAGYEKRFRKNRKAWRYFEAQSPSYRRRASFWVMSAKRAETRQRRLAALIADSAVKGQMPIVTGKKST